MEKIEIEGELDRSWIISLIAEGFDTYQILKHYDLSENLILDCKDLLDKNILIQGLNFSETFIRKSLELEYFTIEDLQNLTMSTYSKLSHEFIQEYHEILNWKKLIVFISTQTNNLEKYVYFIDRENLWNYISANDLPIEFIRNYADKFNWSRLSLVKCFTDEEKIEFAENIVPHEEIQTQYVTETKETPDYEKDFSVDDIQEIIDRYFKNSNVF